MRAWRAKDVEDELRAVENAAGQRRFKVAQLGRRKVVIEEDEIGLRGSSHSGNFVNLAGADKGGGVWLGTALQEFRGHLAAGADQELAEFSERLLSRETGQLVG